MSFGLSKRNEVCKLSEWASPAHLALHCLVNENPISFLKLSFDDGSRITNLLKMTAEKSRPLSATVDLVVVRPMIVACKYLGMLFI